MTDEEDDEVKPGVVTSRHVTLEVQVPHHAVGAVIGSQGSQIKQVLLSLHELVNSAALRELTSYYVTVIFLGKSLSVS